LVASGAGEVLVGGGGLVGEGGGGGCVTCVLPPHARTLKIIAKVKANIPIRRVRFIIILLFLYSVILIIPSPKFRRYILEDFIRRFHRFTQIKSHFFYLIYDNMHFSADESGLG